MIRVKFLKDYAGENLISFKENQIVEIDEGLAWTLATQGYVRFQKTPDPEVEKAKQIFKASKKKSK